MTLTDFLSRCKTHKKMNYVIFDDDQYADVEHDVSLRGTFGKQEFIVSLGTDQCLLVSTFLQQQYAYAQVQHIIFAKDAVCVFIDSQSKLVAS